MSGNGISTPGEQPMYNDDESFGLHPDDVLIMKYFPDCDPFNLDVIRRDSVHNIAGIQIGEIDAALYCAQSRTKPKRHSSQ
jgi:hypothetical protein